MTPLQNAQRKALAPYQQRWLADKSRRKLLVKSRRIGGTEVVTMEAAWSAAGFDPFDGGLRLERGQPENLISASQEQSSAMLQKYVLRHLLDLERLPADTVRMVPIAKKHGMPLTPAVLLALHRGADGAKPNGGFVFSKKARLAGGLVVQESSERILLRNGVEIKAFPANPRTARGFNGNVTLDEFAFMPFSDQIWAAAKPVADPNLGNPRGYNLRVISTPGGDSGHFYDLASTAAGDAFSRHRVTIWQAVQEGFPADIEALRREMGDDELFMQEYGCVFLSSAARYLSAELLDRATYEAAAELQALLRLHGWGRPGLPTSVQAYSGLDIAGNLQNRQSGDFAALARSYRVIDTDWIDPKLTAGQGVSFATQGEWVRGELRAGVRRVCVDATGMGVAPAQQLEAEFKDRVEGVVFTQQMKEELATRLRQRMEQGKVRIPQDAALRHDLMNLRRTLTQQGGQRFDVERDKKGHGDRAWAVMLALHAGSQPQPYQAQRGFRH